MSEAGPAEGSLQFLAEERRFPCGHRRDKRGRIRTEPAQDIFVEDGAVTSEDPVSELPAGIPSLTAERLP